MNGFTNSILSMLLSWLKALINDLWRLVSGDEGGALLRWLAENWKALVLVICIAGFVLDRVVYFIRWRPDYVWRSRRRRTSREIPDEEQQPLSPDPPPQPQEYDLSAYQRPVYQTPAEPETRLYQPVQPAVDPMDVDPVFDDEPIDWEPPQAPSDFGAPRPEPLAYLRDVQAGFAPPQTPRQMYSVHPGLDDQAIRQNFGLNDQGEPASLMHVPTWQPFPNQPEKKNHGVLARFAQKARNLVSMEDEDNAPTIHDLQPPVDRTQAFHDPVYPAPRDWQDGDDL